MLNRYPDFRKERIDARTIEAALDDEERRVVDTFIDYCAITAANARTPSRICLGSSAAKPSTSAAFRGRRM